MERLERVRAIVDGILEKQTDTQLRREGYVHLYGVSLFATELAMRRGLSIERCAVTGLLHDIARFETGEEADHEIRSAERAREILGSVEGFTPEEITGMMESISLHRLKRKVHGPYAEVLKDADALHHYLYPPGGVSDKEKKRLMALAEEIGLPLAVSL